MADERGGGDPERTFSIEEVGEIIRRASADAAPPASVRQHDRISWEELREIASEVGVNEGALSRAVTAPAPAAPPAPVEPRAASPSPVLWRDVGLATAAVATAGGLDLALGLGGALVGLAGGVALIALGARAVWVHLRNLMPDEPTLPADQSYRVMFGNGTVDLTHLAAEGPVHTVLVDVFFGEAEVRLRPSLPYRIESSVLFGEARLPRSDRSDLGEPEGPPRLILRLRVRFGQVTVRLITPPPTIEGLLTGLLRRLR